MSNYPTACTDCNHKSTCKTCYGSLDCHYAEEIKEAILQNKNLNTQQ